MANAFKIVFELTPVLVLFTRSGMFEQNKLKTPARCAHFNVDAFRAELLLERGILVDAKLNAFRILRDSVPAAFSRVTPHLPRLGSGASLGMGLDVSCTSPARHEYLTKARHAVAKKIMPVKNKKNTSCPRNEAVFCIFRGERQGVLAKNKRPRPVEVLATCSFQPQAPGFQEQERGVRPQTLGFQEHGVRPQTLGFQEHERGARAEAPGFSA